MTVKNLTSEDFPLAVRPFWENFEGDLNMRLGVVLTSIVCYSGLSPRLRVKYLYDFGLSMPTLNLLIIGHSGAGKQMYSWIVSELMKPLRLRDEDERRKLREYKEAKRRKGANKDSGAEPLAAIRFLQKFSLPVAVKYSDLMYRKYGDWMPFFLWGSELGSFVQNKKDSAEFQSVARTAYSLGELYSRDTLYEDGYNAIVDINWCSILTGQELALDKYINKDSVVEGDAGRHILVTIGETLGEKIGRFRPLTPQQEADIHKATSRMMAETYAEDGGLMPTHQVDMSWLDGDVERWCDRTLEQVVKNGSRAMESFYVRASCSAYRICTILYHLWDEDEARHAEVRRCYLYFAQMILDSMMAKWGRTYEGAMKKDESDEVKPQCLYDQMPKRFTRPDLLRKQNELGLSSRDSVVISKWKKRHLIYEVEPGVYEKNF